MKKITLLFVLFVGFTSYAQRTCGMDHVMQGVNANPALRHQHEQNQQKFEIELEKLNNSSVSQRNTNNTIRIPVAVHFPGVPNTSSATLKNCLISMAQRQINVLNADFNATNTDISQWGAVSSFYPMVTALGDLNVEFVIATQNHPAGYGVTQGQPLVTFGYNFGAGVPSSQPLYDGNFAGYLNFVVKDIGSGLLGYAPLGGSPALGHAVAINTFCFGTGSQCNTTYRPTAPFNLGRTTTHELGHYFFLDHTFNNGSCSTASCTNQGDKICDTPQVFEETYECPSAGDIAGCVSGQFALTMNYMDYVNDACMFMFTLGQENRMRSWYTSIASEFNMTTLSNNEVVKNNFNIFPNPNNGTFTIRFNDLSDDYSVEVFDISGRIVFEDYYTQSSNLEQTISIDKPSSGVYFVNVKSGSSIITEKIIIK